MDTATYIKKIEGMALNFARGAKRRFIIKRTTTRVLQWVAVLTLTSTTISFIVDGRELFTRQMPQFYADVVRWVMLGGNFRPYLAEHIVRNELVLQDVCISGAGLLDLDANGSASDLLIVFQPAYEGDGVDCDEYESGPQEFYAIFKDTGESDVWSSYALLKLIARQTIGTLVYGAGLPLGFENIGPFLLAEPYGTDFPGYQIYAYHKGVLHDFGGYSAVGASEEYPQAIPKMVIGNRLILHAEGGFLSFEITPDGDFVRKKLSAFDIVNINNNVAFIEENYDQSSTGDGCENRLEMNGSSVQLDQIVEDDAIYECTGAVNVYKENQIVVDAPCEYDGFVVSNQFPWGMTPDAAATEHSIACHLGGEDLDSKIGYKLTVNIRDDY